MKSNRNCEAEKSQIKQLKEENKLLKQKISKLEKVLDRINPNDVRIKNLIELKDKFKEIQKEKEKELCPSCSSVIIVVKVPSVNGIKEIKRCSGSCSLKKEA